MKPHFSRYTAISYRALFACLLLLACDFTIAESLDEGVRQDPVLHGFSEALAAHQIDVTSNLNARAVIAQRIRRARLGRFPDLPVGTFPDSAEIARWEAAYRESEIGGLAIIVEEAENSRPQEGFSERWLDSEQRLFVTFYRDDYEAAAKFSRIAAAAGYASELHFEGEAASAPGQRYATAAQRLAIDSLAARRSRSEVTELDYLGERVRRRSNSLFNADGNRGDRSLARNEPSVFMKETLGDEFNQSTISEIIVPGGVALGESAKLDMVPTELVFDLDGLAIIDEQGQRWELPEIALADAKALFDFVNRSGAIKSDAIVDIDADARVKISSALRDTDVGFAIMHADTQPFEFVPNLPVSKSVIIDTGVQWRAAADGGPLEFETDFEVRFLSADNMRIAQTRVALQYEYLSSLKTAEYSDSWGRSVGRLHDNLNYSGLGKSMADVANYAGWVGLLRRLHEEEVRFLRGRYDFMKIEKTGQETPTRY